MAKCILIILFQMSFFMLKGLGQNNKTPLYLTNYTYSKSQNDIGYIRINPATSAQIKTIKIRGEYSKVLTISKDYKLSIGKGKVQPGIKQMDVVLDIKTSKGNFKDTFRIVNNEFIRNKVVAHRGAWKNTGVTENSIAALKNAIAMGCEGSEFDVHMSSDSVLFIHHDPGVQGVSIAKSTSAVLRDIKLSNGERLPTLEDYLKAGIGQNKTKLILEIKMSELGKASSIALTNKVVQLVEKLHAQAWVDYISFDYDVCKEVMKLAPYAKVAYLNGDKAPAELAQNNFFGFDYHFNVLQKNPTWIKEAQQNKLTVNVWTVNDKAMMERLLQENVDFITTNEPELLLTLIGK